MNILHIVDFGKAGKINGVGEAVMNLAYKQKTLGVSVTILHTRPANINNNLCIELKNVNDFERIVDNIRPEIAIFHSFYDFSHPKIAKILSRKGIPYLITYHGGASKNNYKKKTLLKFLVNKFIFISYIKKAAGTIYLNQNEQHNSIFKNIDKEKFVILPNGINPPLDSNKYKKNDKVIISFISRLDFHGKGLDLLLPAISNIRNELEKRKVHFRFYGYHYDDGTIEKIQSLPNICSYEGFVLDQQKDLAFRDTDIYILPSRSEGMPISVLEALSYGIPCILTPQTNMSELIKDNQCGWTIELNIQDISDKILTALDDLAQNRSVLRKNCIETAKQFEWNQIAIQSIRIYENFLKS